MKLIDQSVKIEAITLKADYVVEKAGRMCYDSKMADCKPVRDSFIQGLKKKSPLCTAYDRVQRMETLKTRSYLTHSFDKDKNNVLKVITVDKPTYANGIVIPHRRIF